MIRLYELRTEKGLSQREMAKQLNISQGTYNNWENSNTQPSIEQLINLADFFHVSVDYLIGHSDDFGNISPSEQLSKEQTALLKLFDNLDTSSQKAIITLLTNK